MKILLWAPFGAGTHFWGPGTSAYRLYKKKQNVNVKIDLVHGTNQQKQFPHVFNNQYKLVDIYKKSLFTQVIFILKAKRWIKRHNQEYDVFHGIGAFETTFRPALYWVKRGKPAFIKVTGKNGGFGKNSFLSRILGLARSRIRNANKITGYFVISEEIKENLLKYGIDPKRIIMIPNAVDTTVFTPVSYHEKQDLRKALQLQNIYTFLYVGGLTENKRIKEIVLSMHNLLSHGRDAQLVIVGPDRSGGVILSFLKNYIAKYDLADRVILVDATPSPEQYYQIADAFVLASKSEGMPNALLEAMATGLPSIVTPISGNIDLVDNFVHGVYTDGSVSDIEEKLIYLLDNQANGLVYGQNSLNKIRKYYTNEIILSKHLQIFTNV